MCVEEGSEGRAEVRLPHHQRLLNGLRDMLKGLGRVSPEPRG